MKILMLNYEFPPLGGGAGNATNNISRNLVERGHQVTVLTSGYGRFPKTELKEGVRILRVPAIRNSIHDCGFKGALSYVAFALPRFIQLYARERFDILHYFFSMPTGLLSLVPGVFKNTPYVVSLRGSDVPGYDVYNRPVHLFHKVLKPLNLYIWRKSGAVVALSESLKHTALKTSPDLRIDVIANGVETDLFRPLDGLKDDRCGMSLITVSRLINRKGIDMVLKALHEINDPNIRLLIVGEGNYKPQLMSLAEKLGLSDRVTFYGYCPRDELPALYSRACVFVLPSFAESFGMVFAEAMACHLPVIGSRVGGVVDLVRPENGILIPQGDVEMLKSAILKIKDSPQLRMQMGKNSRRRVELYYSWASVGARYEAVYQRVLGHASKDTSSAFIR